MKDDPKHYREISVPFASSEDANVALHAFFSEVEAARNKHRIADVVVLCEVSHELDGHEVRGSASSSYGDSSRVVEIVARAYGSESARHEDRMALLMANARRTARK